jgi:large subunit ribosomal protein L33
MANKSKGKKNKKRKLIGLVCEVTGLRHYYTTKGPNSTEKISLKKYNPVLKKHTVYTETKKNLGRNVAPSSK